MSSFRDRDCEVTYSSGKTDKNDAENAAEALHAIRHISAGSNIDPGLIACAKAIKVIDSCRTLEQLAVAHKYAYFASRLKFTQYRDLKQACTLKGIILGRKPVGPANTPIAPINVDSKNVKEYMERDSLSWNDPDSW